MANLPHPPRRNRSRVPAVKRDTAALRAAPAKLRPSATSTLVEMMTTPAPTFADLVALTKDPADALYLIADLFTASAYRLTRTLAARTGQPIPPAPAPQSKYLHDLTTSLKEKTGGIVALLDIGEIERLIKLGPTLARRFQQDDVELVGVFVRLMCMTPEDAAVWIREHFDEIEKRYAS